jgi:hypothetical protein
MLKLPSWLELSWVEWDRRRPGSDQQGCQAGSKPVTMGAWGLFFKGPEVRTGLHSLEMGLTALPKRGRTPRGGFLDRKEYRLALRQRSK